MAANNFRVHAVLGGIAASLFVTVMGGLIVEWLKPSEKKGSDSSVKALTSPTEPLAFTAPPPSDTPSSKNNVGVSEKPSIIGKWRINSKNLEFFPGGNLVVEIDGKTSNFPFTIDEKGHAHIKKGDVTIETVSVSHDELVLHWHERFTFVPDTDFVERYQRVKPSAPWTTTQVVMAVGATIVGIVIVLACIGAVTEKKSA